MYGEIEYCGDCVVCDEPVDSSEMGACKSCGSAFTGANVVNGTAMNIHAAIACLKMRKNSG